jgi:hypothetical protein
MSALTSSPKFEMTVDLNVLEHLGINLYSNIAAVLTEAVANAWDADAEHVAILVDPNGEWIEITDDGVGMSVEELNGKYLRVGYRRREEDAVTGQRTAKGRPVMGRKGLGKLSLFSIADVIEVRTAKDGVVHGLRMTVPGIQQAVKDKQPYHPTELPTGAPSIERGTKIVLRDIKRQRLGKGVTALRKRLARRFSIIGQTSGFEITIDGAPITAADRGDLPKAQFLWTFESYEPEAETIAHVKEREALPARFDAWDASWRVTGWLGTARKPKDLDDDEAGNLNGIVVFARGRLIHENVLDRLNDGRLYTKYLTGQIEADFLDTDDRPDIATSDRQRIQEDDERYIQLIAFLRSSLNQLESRWNEWRRKHEVEKVKEESPALKQWLDSLGGGFRKSAESLIAKLSALPLDEEADRTTLYRHGVLAFERMKLRGSTEELAANVESLDKLLQLLGDRDALEASLYRDIVKSRLEAIAKFDGLIDDDAKEKVLQQYLFDHLWLLDPSWERAAGSELMEKRLTEEGVVIDDLTEKEKLGRVDIKYRTSAGKHIVVELKKAGRRLALHELEQQGRLYVDKLKKILAAQNESSPNIEVVFVLGKTVEDELTNPERVKYAMASVSPGSRITHYDTLIKGAHAAYADYLEQSKKLDKLEAIVNGI